MNDAGKPKERKLTKKQEHFCQLYTVYWNATRAAKEAGYSEKSAKDLGYQLLQIPLLRSRIEELALHAMNEIGIKRERVLAEYSSLAFCDIGRALDGIGQLLPLKEMPEDVRRAIHKIKVVELFDSQGDDKHVIGHVKEIEFAQKKGALDSLAKYLGLAPDRVELSGPSGKPIEMRNYSELSDEELEARLKELDAKRDASRARAESPL